MTCDRHEWCETAIAGLQVRGDGAEGMRLLGWEGVLPVSVVRTVVTAGAAADKPTQRGPVGSCA